MAKEDLLPVRTKEEAKQRGHNGGVKSGEARRAKKTIRDVAKYLMNSEVSKDMPNVKETLRRMGVPETDQTYQAAVAVRLMQKAMVDGDTSAIRLLGELTGDLGPDGYAVDQIRQTMTVGELIAFLSDFDEDMPIYTSQDNGYTYGGIEYDNFREEENEEEDE